MTKQLFKQVDVLFFHKHVGWSKSLALCTWIHISFENYMIYILSERDVTNCLISSRFRNNWRKRHSREIFIINYHPYCSEISTAHETDTWYWAILPFVPIIQICLFLCFFRCRALYYYWNAFFLSTYLYCSCHVIMYS